MGRKLGFLLLLLAFGATVETAWRVKHHAGWDIGAEGCRVIGGKFYGPSFAFDDETTQPLATAGPVAVENAFGSVTVGTGAAGQVRVQIRSASFAPPGSWPKNSRGRSGWSWRKKTAGCASPPTGQR